MLDVRELSVQRDGKKVFENVSFQINPGDLVILTGSNGAGKSTLALTLFGHPSCEINYGSIVLDGTDISQLKTYERVRRGLFLAHQEPPAIAGVSVTDALRAASDAIREVPYTTAEFFDQMRRALERLHLSQDFAKRTLHEAFSGGEKKRLELLFLLILSPRYAILDEVDSGMDMDAREITKEIIAEMRSVHTGFLVISHSNEFVNSLGATKIVSLQK